MKNSKGKNVWIGVAVILVVAIIVFLFSLLKKETVGVDGIISPNSNNTALFPPSTLDTSGSSVQGTKPISISYIDALAKYANKRIQLDKNCQAFPNTVTYKDNTGIMIDNRSPEVRTIKIGTSFTIKAWGFKIITLPNVVLQSKTIFVDCDKSLNVATILVQE